MEIEVLAEFRLKMTKIGYDISENDNEKLPSKP